MKSFQVDINGQSWYLLPEKAIYWKEKSTLILSDIHLGKSGHFRKSGIPAPSGINDENQARMTTLINQHKPDRLLILGDLFHSSVNREWFQFEEWRNRFPELHIHLVKGNHDSLHSSFYDRAEIMVSDVHQEEGFCFKHHPTAQKSEKEMIVAGHLHPGIKLSGKGRQSLRLPCFVFRNSTIILPAFGTFTGLHLIEKENELDIYAVVEDRVLKIKP